MHKYLYRALLIAGFVILFICMYAILYYYCRKCVPKLGHKASTIILVLLFFALYVLFGIFAFIFTKFVDPL